LNKIFSVVLAVVSITAFADAQSFAPYGLDSSTLHLWHLDDVAVPTTDAVSGTNFLPMQGLIGGAALSGTALGEMGTSLVCNSGSSQNGLSLAAPAGDFGLDTDVEDVPFTFANPATGAFTYEALIKFNSTYNPTNPSTADNGLTMQIVSMDGDATSDRIFQFKYQGGSGASTPPSLQFINIAAGGTIQTLSATVPTTGGNAVNNTNWFHVAVTYTGVAGGTNNLSFYWTKMVVSNTAANLIGTTTMTSDIPANAGSFTIGGRSRYEGSPDGFQGNIDEVRISGTARAVTAMMPSNYDTVGVGIPDWWQIKYFGQIGVNPNADPDGNGYTLLQDYLGGANPTIASSTPVNSAVTTGTIPPTGSVTPGSPGVVTTYYPITNGFDQAATGYAYAESSGINTSSFIRSNLETVGGQQFIAYYGEHQTNATYPYNNTIWIARRTLGASIWQVYPTSLLANDITDGHDVVSFGIDGARYMHLSWGMHNAIGNAFHYTRSLAPVTGTNAIVFAPDAHNMTGNEYEVTYPQFINVPNGDLLYIYRVGGAGGGSGDGNTFWNRYSVATQTWSNVNVSGTTVVPMINGIGYSYNGYPNMPCIDPVTGALFLTWTWRYTPAFESNENMSYAQSPDLGVTWQNSLGQNYALGLAEKFVSGTTTNANTIAEQILAIQQNSSLINQSGMCLDLNDLPVIATWWSPGAYSTNTGSTGSGNNERQYMVAFPSATGTGTIWEARQVSNRTVDPPTFIDTNADYVHDLGRPVALCDSQGRILVVYRDDHSAGGITVVYSQTAADDPSRSVWTTVDLTGDNLGGFEPVIDLQRWQRDNVLDIVYVPSNYTDRNGLTYTSPGNSAAQIGVLEWDERAYFTPPTLTVSLSGQNAVLSWQTILGSGYEVQTSTDLVNWTAVNTSTGDGTIHNYIHSGGAAGAQRFWRLQIKEGSF
jgi:hypothetical protein